MPSIEDELYYKALVPLGLQSIAMYAISRHYPIFGASDFSYMLDDSKKRFIEKTPLKSFWVARTFFKQAQLKYPTDEMIIAVAKTEKWHKGVVLIESLFEAKKYELRAVDLPDWHDPFLAALQSANLARFSNANIIDDGGYTVYRCTVTFLSGATFGEIFFEGPMKAKGRWLKDHLWDAFCRTVNDLVDFYDNVELSDHMAETIFAFNR